MSIELQKIDHLIEQPEEQGKRGTGSWTLLK